MTNPYPLPRSVRQTEILLGNGGSLYGPFDGLQCFDTADIVVFSRPQGAKRFLRTVATVAKVSGLPFDFFTVAFATAIPVTTEFLVSSRRVAERSAGVDNGTRISMTALEKEISKLASSQQELRRDIDRSLAPDFGDPDQVLPRSDGSSMLGWGPDNHLVNRPNDTTSAGRAEAAAEAAIGASNGQFIFDTVAAASLADIPPAVAGIMLRGFASRADGLGGLWVTDNTGSSDTFVGADGRTWYRVTDIWFRRVGAFSVIPSYGKSRTLDERGRDLPSILDYDNMDESGVANSWQAFDRAIRAEAAFGGRRALLMPNGSRFRLDDTIVLPYRGFNLKGGSTIGTQLFPKHNGVAIMVGDANVAQGFAQGSILERFSIFGDGVNQTGGIQTLDKATQTLWPDASKYIALRDIMISDIGNGPAFRIQGWATTLDRCRVEGGLRGAIFEKQALTVEARKLYITGCSKEGLIIGDTPARIETCNILLLGCIVQQCGGAPGSGAILLRGVAGVKVVDLYLERNGEKDASYDIDISELAVNTSIQNITNRAPPASAIIRDAGLNTNVEGIWNFGSTDAILRRVGALPTGRYADFHQQSGTLGNGFVRDLSTGDAAGRYIFIQDGVVKSEIEDMIPKTVSFTIVPGERGYHVQTTTAISINLPATAPRGTKFDIACSGGGAATLNAASGAVINGGATKALTQNQLYTVKCTRNNGGSSAQWMTSV